MGHITILQGDITQARVDAIVNAANTQMLGGGGVDGAIHQAAGLALLEECHKIEVVDGVRCPFGEARITLAGELSCKYVIHTVGPIYETTKNPSAVLASAYESSLRLAQRYRCRSIAFPAISCGVYGYPIDEAADIALNICCQLEFDGLDIFFYLFNKETHYAWQQVAARLSN